MLILVNTYHKNKNKKVFKKFFLNKNGIGNNFCKYEIS